MQLEPKGSEKMETYNKFIVIAPDKHYSREKTVYAPLAPLQPPDILRYQLTTPINYYDKPEGSRIWMACEIEI